MSEPINPALPGLDELGSQFARLTSTPEAPRIGRWEATAPAIKAALAAVAIGAVLLTPPGRAVADWVGELVAIVGGTPSVTHHVDQGRADAVVLAGGHAPNGSRFEIVGFESPRPGVGSCIAIDNPELGMRNSNGSHCLGPGDQGGPVSIGGASMTEGLYGEQGAILIGVPVAPSVRKVEVTYRDETGSRIQASTTLASLDGELQEQVGARTAWGFAIAFLPKRTLQSVEAAGFGADGTLIESVPYPAEHLLPPWVSEAYAAKHGAVKAQARLEQLRELCQQAFKPGEEVHDGPCADALGR